jgi:hypothetical protein
LSQRPLRTQHTTDATDQHLCGQRDSNPLSQQSSGCRPKPYTARPPGPAKCLHYLVLNFAQRQFCLQQAATHFIQTKPCYETRTDKSRPLGCIRGLQLTPMQETHVRLALWPSYYTHSQQNFCLTYSRSPCMLHIQPILCILLP